MAQTAVSAAKPFITAADSKFGGQIEGTAVDQAGNVFTVDFGKKTQTINQLSPKQKLFFTQAKLNPHSFFARMERSTCLPVFLSVTGI